MLVLRYDEDLGDATIAHVLGLTEGNIRVIAHRALSALRSAPEAADAEVGGRHTVGS